MYFNLTKIRYKIYKLITLNTKLNKLFIKERFKNFINYITRVENKIKNNY
jgi:hypothetical protein